MFEQNIKEKCRDIRISTIEAIGSIGVGHVGGSLSIVDALGVLYFSDTMNIDPKEPKKTPRDRLVLSKGHAGPALYATLALKGYFDKSELLTLNKIGTNLPSHCDMNKTVGIDMTTGSLGQGFSCAVGLALGSKLKKDGAYIYAIIGDGESQEGQVWEAAMLSSQYNLNNLIAFTDYNKLQIDGTTDEINALDPLKLKWEAFGFQVYDIDGHDIKAIYETIQDAKKSTNKPTMIILNTIKGKGVSFIEEMKAGNHNAPLSSEDVKKAVAELTAAV